MNMNKLLALIMIGLISITIINCSKSNPAKTEYNLTNTEAIYEIPVEKLAVVKIEENPTTGYTWHYYIEDESVLTFNSEETKVTKSDPTVLGAPIIHIWKFKTLKSGTTLLKFAYARDWEAKAIEAKDKLEGKFPRLKEWNARWEASIQKYEFTINVK